MRHRPRVIAAVLAAATLPGFALAFAQEAEEAPRDYLRDGFEGPRAAWRQEKTDAVVELIAHERTKQSTREGAFSEGFRFRADVGSGFFYSYALPKVPVAPSLQVSLSVRSDRSGVQLLGRVVIPEDVDPDTGQPSFVTVAGTILETADAWTRLELNDIDTAVERQARLLRVSTKRKISLRGAYLDRLIVNLYGGPGETTVYLDDLKVGPVPRSIAATFQKNLEAIASGRGAPARVEGPAPNGESARKESPIKLDRNGLTRQGFPWAFTAVRAPGADPEKLRKAGFDLLAVPIDADPDQLKRAVETGMWLMPEFDGKSSQSFEPGKAIEQAKLFPYKENVAFWSMGRDLGRANDLAGREAERDRVRAAAKALREMGRAEGFSGLTTGTVVGLHTDYARAPENLNAMGIAPFGWGTNQELSEFQLFLEERKNLAASVNPDALQYAWIKAAAPPVYSKAIWGVDRVPSWGLPRVQPEQLRSMVYAALASGVRGIGIDADAELTNGFGRMLLIESALLNEEIDLFEWLVGDPSKSVKMLSTFSPEPPQPPPPQNTGIGTKKASIYKKEKGPNPTIKAAMLGTKDRRGAVLLVGDYAENIQYQPPQLAKNNVVIDVPAPADAQAYEFSPGDVRVLTRERVPGGIRVKLDEFGPTSLIFVTTDSGRVAELQQAVLRVRPLAIGLAIEQAQLEINWVAEIHQMLADQGHNVREAEEFLSQATAFVKSAMDARDREDYGLAWAEARRASRPLRILMRSHWEMAYGALTEALNDVNLPCGPSTPGGDLTNRPVMVRPTACPPLASFNTLPKFWTWLDWIRRGRLGRNLIEGGTFDEPSRIKQDGWVDESYQTRDVIGKLQITSDGIGRGERQGCLTMTVAAEDPRLLDRLPGFLDHPAAAIRTPPIRVKAAEIVQVSVSVKMPIETVAGAGGVIIRDSIGGEAMEFRKTAATAEWRDVVFYRRAPVDGLFTVTLGLAGYGTVKFDNVQVRKIEALIGKGAATAGATPTPPTIR